MRISRVIFYRLCIPFRHRFAHSLYDRGQSETVIVIVQDTDGVSGVGEALPRPYVTGETLRTVCERLNETALEWCGREFLDFDDVVLELQQGLHSAGRSLAAWGAWELAILDLAGKVFAFDAGRILTDHVGPELPVGHVIGLQIPTHNLERHCALLRFSRAQHLKVKLGAADDLRRLEIITGFFGPDLSLRVDANGCWTANEALSALRSLRRLPIMAVEQPVRPDDLTGMNKVRRLTGLPVIADESVCTYGDAERVIASEAADAFNIRLGKCGGLLGSLRLVKLARDHGLHCHLGTLVGETGVLSRAAEMFGRRVDGFHFLEGKGQNHHLLVEDIVEARDFGDVVGLGIDIQQKKLEKWVTSAPQLVEVTHTCS